MNIQTEKIKGSKVYEQMPKDYLKDAGVVVFKLRIGDVFYIGHTTSPEWFVSELSATLGRYRRNGIDEDNLLLRLVEHIHKNHTQKIFFDVLYISKNGYDVLKYELEQLKAIGKTTKSLNTNTEPYIPKTTHAKKGSNWLTQNQYLNYMKHLKKQTSNETK